MLGYKDYLKYHKKWLTLNHFHLFQLPFVIL